MKTNPTRWHKKVVTGSLLVGAVLFMAGCAVEAPAPYPPGGYGGYYDYYYYPDADVYFYPTASLYFWVDGGRWVSGRRLPPRYVLHDEHREQLHVQSRRPWTSREQRRPEQHGEFGHRPSEGPAAQRRPMTTPGNPAGEYRA